MRERTVDPATLAVISGWLQQIVDEVDEFSVCLLFTGDLRRS